jgi:RimJ/RimL family protein N-acetyltransferase
VPLPFPEAGLSDGRVGLRRWRRDDLDSLVAACQDPEIQRWTTVPSPYTVETGTWFLDRCDQWWDAGSDLPLAIVDATDGSLLGASGVHRIAADPEDPELGGLPDEVGYWLAAHARGRGHVTRAVRMLASWWFDAFDRPSLWLRTRTDNERSMGVAERCGFLATGIMMPDEDDPTIPLLVFRRDREIS